MGRFLDRLPLLARPPGWEIETILRDRAYRSLWDQSGEKGSLRWAIRELASLLGSSPQSSPQDAGEAGPETISSSPSAPVSGSVDRAKVEEINPGVARWASEVEAVSRETGVPADVLLAIMDIESDGNPDVVSPAGAVGLMQILPQYHAHRAQKYGGNLQDPRVNIRVGAEILKEKFDQVKARNPSLSDDQAWALAAAAYFGALDWKTLSVTGARDAIGTSGYQYVDLFTELRSRYRRVYQEQGILAQPLFGGLYQVSAWTGGQSYPLTQGFGETEFARTSGFYAGGRHPGIDLGVPHGTPITAPFQAKVIQAGWNGGYGYSVTLEVQANGKTYQILVGHMAEVPSVSVGQIVQPGQVLGKVGSTGASTGPHIHLEVRENGVPVDPKVLFVY
jgi:murein DD-endopeptidase MepM/ murein hydrolase activator NlpD